MSAPGGCAGCGRGPDPGLAQLQRVDSEIAWRRARAVDLRRNLGQLEREVDGLLRQRVDLAANLERRQQWAPRQQPAPQPVAAPPPMPAPPSPTEEAPVPAPPRPEASARSIQNVLLILGGVLSAAAVIVFTVVAWATFGAVGRAAILLVITAVMMAVPLWLWRKGLSSTAETLSGLAVLMPACDGFAFKYLHVLPPINNGSQASQTVSNAVSHGVHTPTILFGCVALTAIALGYRMVTRMLVPGFAVVTGGSVTLVLGYVQTGRYTGTAALALLLVILVLAAWLFERVPARQGRRASLLLTQLTGGLAVLGGIAVVTFGLSGVEVGGWPIATITPAALAAAAAVTYCPRLPRPWRRGPAFTAYVSCGLLGAISVAIAAVITAQWTMKLMPLWHFGSHGSDGPYPQRVQLLVVLAVMTAAMTSVEWLRRRWWLIAAAVTVCVVAVPAALDLNWAVAAAVEGAVAMLFALVAATGPRAAARTALTCGAVPFGYALLLASEGQRVSLAIAVALTLALLAIGVVALRDERSSVAGLTFGMAAWTGLSAAPLGLHLAGMTAHHLTPIWTLAVAAVLLTTAASLTLAETRVAPESETPTPVPGHGTPQSAAAAAGPGPAAGHGESETESRVDNEAATTNGRETTEAGSGVDPDAVTQPQVLPRNGSVGTDWRVATLPGLFLAALTAIAGTVGLCATLHASPVDLIAAAALVGACYALLGVATLGAASRFTAATALSTIAVLTGLAELLGAWWPREALFIHTGVAIVGALAAAALPRAVSRGASWGAAVVAVGSTAISAVAALSSLPAMWGLTPPLPWLDWRTPFILALAGLAAAALLPRRWRVEAAAACGGLAVLAMPVAWAALPWWAGPSLALALACGYAAWAVLSPTRSAGGGRIAVAAAAAAHALTSAVFDPLAPSASAAYALTARLGLVTVLACAAIAVTARRRQPIVGGVAVSCAIMLLPGVLVMAGLADSWPAQRIQLAAMMAACAGLLIAALLKVFGSPYLAWATIAVPGVATACARAGLPSAQSPMFVATAGLVGIGAGMLMLPNRRAAAIRTGLSSVSILSTFASAISVPLVALVYPYRWLASVWDRTPVHALDGLGDRAHHLAGGPVDLAVLAIGSTAVVLAVLGLAGRRAAAGVAMGALLVVLPSVPTVLDLPWQLLPYVTIAVAGFAYLLCSHVRLGYAELFTPVGVALIAGGAAIAGSLATPNSTVGVLALTCAATLSGALAGASDRRRAVGWLLSAAALSGLVIAMGFAVHLSATKVALGAIAVSVLLLAVASLRGRPTGGATWAAELGGHLAALPALGLAAAYIPRLSVVLVIYGAVLGLLAVRAPHSRGGESSLLWNKRGYALAATATALAAYWLLLGDAEVSTIEVYTVPFALLTILGGWLELRRHPRLRSWLAYGPGLCLGLLPTLALILVSPDQPLRRLLLGAASMTILLLGTWRRLQAPVVAAGIVLTIQALREMSLLWMYVSSWVPLGIGGVLLLLVGGTFERRRREMAKVRRAVAAMR